MKACWAAPVPVEGQGPQGIEDVLGEAGALVQEDRDTGLRSSPRAASRAGPAGRGAAPLLDVGGLADPLELGEVVAGRAGHRRSHRRQSRAQDQYDERDSGTACPAACQQGRKRQPPRESVRRNIRMPHREVRVVLEWLGLVEPTARAASRSRSPAGLLGSSVFLLVCAAAFGAVVVSASSGLG